jgi:hypothetical protein
MSACGMLVMHFLIRVSLFRFSERDRVTLPSSSNLSSTIMISSPSTTSSPQWPMPPGVDAIDVEIVIYCASRLLACAIVTVNAAGNVAVLQQGLLIELVIVARFAC